MKKLLNPLVTAIIGLFVGGLLVFVYNSTRQSSIIGEPEKSKEPFIFNEQGANKFSPIGINEARKMIEDLYDFMLSNPASTPSLFKRSFALSLDDLKSAINISANPTDDVKVRIYPGLRVDSDSKKPILSFILVVEKNKSLIWGNDSNSIQDYWGPCPKDCPTNNDLFTEADWQKKMRELYEKP